MKLQFQNMHRGARSGSRAFQQTSRSWGCLRVQIQSFLSHCNWKVGNDVTILWPNFDWGKIVFVFYCDKIGKKCLKAEFTREIAQFLFCYKIWWYLRHEGIQEMANDRWIKHFRHSRASWVIQLALWRRLSSNYYFWSRDEAITLILKTVSLTLPFLKWFLWPHSPIFTLWWLFIFELLLLLFWNGNTDVFKHGFKILWCF